MDSVENNKQTFGSLLFYFTFCKETDKLDILGGIFKILGRSTSASAEIKVGDYTVSIDYPNCFMPVMIKVLDKNNNILMVLSRRGGEEIFARFDYGSLKQYGNSENRYFELLKLVDAVYTRVISE